MNYLIIEDEEPAANRLNRLVNEIDANWNCIDVLASVSTAIKWFKQHEQPELIFMDIQLADGDSFEIFNSVSIKSHVIFITAFDKYAIKAFKFNSVDYLLKPVKPEELESAINKFKSLAGETDQHIPDLSKLLGEIRSDKKYQKRLLIKFGDTFKAVEISDVAYFFTQNRGTYVCTYENVKYPIDETLDHLIEMLDPSTFHRINRQFIISINSIEKMVSYSKSRVKLDLKPPAEEEIIVSTDRSPEFKQWLKG